jgi:hypothetical protein
MPHGERREGISRAFTALPLLFAFLGHANHSCRGDSWHLYERRRRAIPGARGATCLSLSLSPSPPQPKTSAPPGNNIGKVLATVRCVGYSAWSRGRSSTWPAAFIRQRSDSRWKASGHSARPAQPQEWRVTRSASLARNLPESQVAVFSFSNGPGRAGRTYLWKTLVPSCQELAELKGLCSVPLNLP